MKWVVNSVKTQSKMKLLAFFGFVLAVTATSQEQSNENLIDDRQKAETQNKLSDDEKYTAEDKIEISLVWVGYSRVKYKLSANLSFFYSASPNEIVFFPLKDFEFLIHEKSFDASLPTVIYAHSWLADSTDDSIVAIRRAYMEAGGYNVLTLDWSHFTKLNEGAPGSKRQLKIVSHTSRSVFNLKYFFCLLKVAEVVAENLQKFVNSGYNFRLIHLVGHAHGWGLVNDQLNINNQFLFLKQRSIVWNGWS